MSTFVQSAGRRNATSDDCGRLWSHLTTEYISDLKISLYIKQDTVGKAHIQMQVESPGLDAKTGQPCLDIWSSTTFFNELNLISSERLFDLLINAHRRIQDYFSFGEACGPSRMG